LRSGAWQRRLSVSEYVKNVEDVSDLPRSTPRVRGSTSWSRTDKPFFIEPLFTRDPRLVKPVHVLMAMKALRGIELILPTYGEQVGLKGRICRRWA